ncbi:MAG: EamA family transporter [Bdellovibrionia bacterium]
MTSIQFGATFAKQLFPFVGTAGSSTLRLLLATVILFVVWKPWRGKISRAEIRSIALYGISLGSMNLLFYMALARIPLGIGVALEFTGPLAVSLASSRRIGDVFWAVLAVTGILLLMPVSDASTALDPIGVGYALAAGVAWALYILFGQRAGASMHGGRATSLGMLVATLVVLPIGVFQEGAKLLDLKLFPIAFSVALLGSAVPYTLEMFVLKKLPAKTFGILMSLEPAIAAISGLFLLNERLSLVQWSAIGCIIAASTGSSLSMRHDTVPPLIEAPL